MEIDFLISDTLTKAIYQRLMSKGVICSFSSKLHCLNIVIPHCYSSFHELNALGYTCVYFCNSLDSFRCRECIQEHSISTYQELQEWLYNLKKQKLKLCNYYMWIPPWTQRNFCWNVCWILFRNYLDYLLVVAWMQSSTVALKWNS